jgi:hypothetical protein
VAYLYAGLKAGASPQDVLDRADADGAPFTKFDDLREFVTSNMEQLADKS